MNKHDPALETDYLSLKQAEAALPARWYYDADHYRRELAGIWQTNWAYVCRSTELAEPLAYRTVEIGNQNLVVLRDGAGELKAFHNACRHRGSILCTGREGRLKSKLITCPYHQWAYAAEDGRLVNTTSFAEPDGFDKRDYPLFPVAVAQWRGLIFINLDPNAAWSNEAAFQREPTNLANHPIEDMVTVHTWRKVMACNWKTFWENFNECLHCPGVHPELCELVPMFSRRIVNPKDVPDWQDHADSTDPKYRGGMRDGGETWSMDASAQGHVITALTDEDLARGHTYASAWPSVFIAGYPDHVRIVRLLPVSAEETELQAEWLLEKSTAEAPDYDQSKIVDFATLVIEQDVTACELNQRGLHAAPLQQGVLMPEEYLLKRFHDWVRDQLNAAA